MGIAIIVAYDENNVIGINNEIPWKIPSDLKNFKKITVGGTVIMGRKTYESIGRPLQKRRNIVLTTNKDWKSDGVEVCHDFFHAMHIIKEDENCFVIGGEAVYEAFLPTANFLYVSHVKTGGNIKGDAFFPRIETDLFFDLIESKNIQESEDEYPYVFSIYKKNNV